MRLVTCVRPNTKTRSKKSSSGVTRSLRLDVVLELVPRRDLHQEVVRARLLASEERDRLDVRRVREHVHRPHALEPVAELADELLRVPGERRRVAGDIDEPRARSSAPTRRSALPDEPGPRRVDDDDVRLARRARAAPRRPRDLAREEGGVRDAVQLGVLDRAGDRLLRRPRCPRPSARRGPSRARSCPIPQ